MTGGRGLSRLSLAAGLSSCLSCVRAGPPTSPPDGVGLGTAAADIVEQAEGRGTRLVAVAPTVHGSDLDARTRLALVRELLRRGYVAHVFVEVGVFEARFLDWAACEAPERLVPSALMWSLTWFFVNDTVTREFLEYRRLNDTEGSCRVRIHGVDVQYATVANAWARGGGGGDKVAARLEGWKEARESPPVPVLEDTLACLEEGACVLPARTRGVADESGWGKELAASLLGAHLRWRRALDGDDPATIESIRDHGMAAMLAAQWKQAGALDFGVVSVHAGHAADYRRSRDACSGQGLGFDAMGAWLADEFGVEMFAVAVVPVRGRFVIGDPRSRRVVYREVSRGWSRWLGGTARVEDAATLVGADRFSACAWMTLTGATTVSRAGELFHLDVSRTFDAILVVAEAEALRLR